MAEIVVSRPALELLEDFERKGGLLGLLIDLKENYPKKLCEEASKIWYEAFKRERVITPKNFGISFAVFSSAYARAKGKRKEELAPYYEKFRELWNRFKTLRDVLFRRIDRLIAWGREVYNMNKDYPYKHFLRALHNWIKEVYEFVEYNKNIFPDHDIVKYYNKCIQAYLDVSVEYVGTNPRHLEHIFTALVHIETLIHYSPIYDGRDWEEVGEIPSPLARCFNDILPQLTFEVNYDHLFPGSKNFLPDWSFDYADPPLNVNAEVYRLAKGMEDVKIFEAHQVGYDIKNCIAELKDFKQLFVGNFIIYDHDYGTVRVEMIFRLPWDWSALEYDTIRRYIEITMEPTKRGGRPRWAGKPI